MVEVDLSAADPIAEVIAWCKTHPKVLAAFGSADHVSGLIEAPWPRLRVDVGPGGDLGDLRWESTTEVTLEAYDDPKGSRGKAALRGLLLVAAQAVKELPDREHVPGSAVVSLVRPSGVLAFTPLASGQLKWTLGLLVTMHPPSDEPLP